VHKSLTIRTYSVLRKEIHDHNEMNVLIAKMVSLQTRLRSAHPLYLTSSSNESIQYSVVALRCLKVSSCIRTGLLKFCAPFYI
jgi:hypothetical protein